MSKSKTGEELLRASEVWKSYGHIRVLKGASFSINQGETVCLMGANGAGKTTLLGTLLSRIGPESGTIAFHGAELKSKEDRTKMISRIAVLGHDPGVFLDLTAEENLQIFWRAYHGRITSAGKDEISYNLRRVGLYERREDLVRFFSRGMRQRLAICRCIQQKPDLLLLDEPLNSLDEDGRRILLEVLGEFVKTGAALIVTHDDSPFKKIAKRFLRLENGRISS